jgi:hypothetical protein
MANEVTSISSLVLSSGVITLDFNKTKLPIKLNYTPLKIYRARLLITTSEVTVTHGVASPRFCVLYNHDVTNYVEAGCTTGVYDTAYLRPASMPSMLEIGPTKSNIFLKANTASCYVEVIVF